MILFFRTPSKSVIATEIDHKPSQDEINELCWLYGDATLEDAQQLQGFYVGPRREMITPWSTNAVEITQNMSLNGISRIEEYFPVDSEDADHDPMLQPLYIRWSIGSCSASSLSTGKYTSIREMPSRLMF